VADERGQALTINIWRLAQLLRAESEQAPRRLVDDDPAVAQGVMRAELFPYRIAYLRGGDP
jgi:hypothetical protein